MREHDQELRFLDTVFVLVQETMLIVDPAGALSRWSCSCDKLDGALLLRC